MMAMLGVLMITEKGSRSVPSLQELWSSRLLIYDRRVVYDKSR